MRPTGRFKAKSPRLGRRMKSGFYFLCIYPNSVQLMAKRARTFNAEINRYVGKPNADSCPYNHCKTASRAEPNAELLMVPADYKQA